MHRGGWEKDREHDGRIEDSKGRERIREQLVVAVVVVDVRDAMCDSG